MTYRHLIARRTALLRGVSAAAVALLAACSDGPTSLDEAPQLASTRSGHPRSASSATQLIATSDHPVIAPADTTVLVATAVDADGTRRTLNAQWTSLDGGKLKRHNNRRRHAMLFTAASAGSYRLVARVPQMGRNDTTVVKVAAPAPAPQVARVVLTPATAGIHPGDTLQLSTHAETATGDTVGAKVAVTATGGELDGLSYSASEPGTYTLVAAMVGSPLRDTSVVTVQPGAITPPEEPAPTVPADTSAPDVTVPDSTVVDTTIPDVTVPSDVSDGGISAAITRPTVTQGTPAELPRVLLDTRVPTQSGRIIQVPAGGNLQTALNSAVRGDVIELAAGATYTGNFTLPAKAGTGWITIRTRTTLPAPGTRMTPALASTARLAKLRTPNSMPALQTAGSPQSAYYRITGVEIISSWTGMTFTLVYLGDPKNVTTSASMLSTDIVLDRVYVHGGTTQSVQRCIALNNRRSAVIDSYVTECHIKGGDSQAIIGWNGPGPFKIVNNYLAGAGENIMFGGADPKISGLVPSDIEIRGNHITKPLAWKSSNLWSVKNLYESKNSQRVLIEDNIFENNWQSAQTGLAILLKSENQSGSCTWCTTADYTFRYNKLINSPGGFMITGSQVTTNGGPSVPARRITISNMLFQQVAMNSQVGAKRLFQIGPKLTDLVISHNTAFSEGMMFFLTGAMGSSTHFVLRDNLFARGSTGLFGNSRLEGTSSINTYAPTATVGANILIGSKSATYPAVNWLVSTTASVGMLSYSGGNYALSSSSPYYLKGSDGKSPGADLAGLATRLAKVK
jgi:hypothetical protein